MNENENESPFEIPQRVKNEIKPAEPTNMPMPNTPVPNMPEPKISEPRITKETAKTIVPIAAVVAVLYSICFTGVTVFPKISFTIFVGSVIVILWFALKKFGYLKNRKAAIWLIPIFIVSLFNGVFDLNLFDYGNVIVVHLLFAVFILNATKEKKQGGTSGIWNMTFLTNVIMTIVGDWTLFVEAIALSIHKENVKKKNSKLFKILIGLVLSVPVIIILLALLLSADKVFQSLFRSSLDFFGRNFYIDRSILIHIPAGCIAFIYFSGYVYNANALCQKTVSEPRNALKVDVTIGATFLILVNALFCVFTIVQFAFLFSGGYMKLPEDVVYSEYAREGFFQLLFVTVINFIVLLFFTLVVQGAKESKLLKTLLVMLCGFTGVLIVSSFYRMNLYIQTYGFTTLRLQVITFLVMEVFLVGVTIGYFLFRKIPLGKYFVLIGLVFYIAVNVTGSDYFATKMNIYRFWNHPDAEIDLVGIGGDSDSLLLDVYASQQYADGEIYRTGSTIYHTPNGKVADLSSQKYTMGLSHVRNIEHWQNWSLLNEVSKQKLQQYEK